MKFILSLLLLLPLMACAAGVNTYTVYPTNFANSGDTITANGTARMFTNVTTATTIATNYVSLADQMTNIFTAYGQYPANITITWGSSTSLVFKAYNLTLGSSAGWLVIATNTAPSTNFYAVGVPHYNMPGTNTANVKTNNANYLMQYLADYATTNWFHTNSIATTNLVSIGVPAGGGVQKIYAPKNFYSLTGTNAGLTNGVYFGGTWTNGEIHSAYLKPFGPDETNYGTIWFYDSGTNIVAAIRANTNGYPSLFDASADDPFQFDGPFLTDLSTNNSEAILNMFSAVTHFPVLAPVTYAGRLTNLWTSTNYWASSGNVFSKSVAFDGGFVSTGGRWTNAFIYNARTTNVTFHGTNHIEALAFTPRVNVGLANGNNAGVVLGTNVYLRLMGPDAAYTIAGFAAEWSGAFHTLQLTNPAGPITIANESGVDATAANRILTSTGADLSLTNNPAFLQIIYDGAASRWRVITHSR